MDNRGTTVLSQTVIPFTQTFKLMAAPSQHGGVSGFTDTGSRFSFSKDKGTTQRRLSVLMLLIIVVLPVASVTVLAIVELNAKWAEFSDLSTMADIWSQIEVITVLIDALQAERLQRCVGELDLNSNVTKACDLNVEQTYTRTDQAAADIPGGTNICGLYTLKTHRLNSDNLCDTDVKTYDDMIQCLLERIFNLERNQETESHFWLLAQTASLFKFANDFTGIKRALGGTFFNGGGFQQQRMVLFQFISQTADEMFRLVRKITPTLSDYYATLAADNQVLITELAELDKRIESSSEANLGLIWFHNMTQYMGLFAKVNAFVDKSLQTELEHIITQVETDKRNNYILVAVVLVICPLLAIVYVQVTRRLMHDQKKYTKRLKTKMDEMAVEKKRTDKILQTMLPRSVAAELRDNGTVQPQQFDSCTVFFSDICGFTRIASQSTPMQVVSMLNELYSRYDDVLDRYDCYKVETIGDAYVVVSGVPKPNHGMHSNEICTMALEIVMLLHDFRIPHSQKHLFMRIGVHTGPSVAGVVGVTMPRYCLFALCIQISKNTKRHLNSNHPEIFTTVERTAKIQTKDDLLDDQTFWLLAKADFAFSIDMEKAAQMYRQTLED